MPPPPPTSAPTAIRPGLPWHDNRGRHIQAHGGGFLRWGKTWYWFGEDRSRENPAGTRCVACYASENLVEWQFRRQVIAWTDPDDLGDGWVLERPKVFFNAHSGKFVLYMHLDGRLPGSDHLYDVASVGVATCDTVDGDYRFVRRFRPLGLESRDIGQFVNDDGAAYLIFESRPSGGFYIAALSEDYLDVDHETAFIRAPMEGGAIVRHDGLYYVIGSQLTGWWPNANQFATSKRLTGPWSEFRDVAPPHTHTWGSQATGLIPVVGTKRTTVIYAGDRWRPEEHWDSRYVWMPVEIGGGTLAVPEPRPWTINVQTGETTIVP